MFKWARKQFKPVAEKVLVTLVDLEVASAHAVNSNLKNNSSKGRNP